MNWCAWGVVLLQGGAGLTWICRGNVDHGVLWVGYALLNVWLIKMAGGA